MKYFIIFLILAGFAVFVPSAFASCVSLPCDDANIKLDEPNYRFIDFSYQNKVGDPITFILEKTAQDNCNSYVATITNEKDETVWEQDEASFCGIVENQNLTTSQIKLGYDPDNKIIMSESAKYILKVQIDDGSIEREFVSRHNFSSISLDRTAYPVTWAFSPLQQFISGIPFDEIKCKDKLVLVQKYDSSPACVQESTVNKLIEREWGTSDNWIKISNANRAIHYDVDGGIIAYVEAFSEYKNPSLPEERQQTWLQIKLESTQDGSLEITLPRNLIDAKISDSDDDFFVLLDGTETEYQETKTESERILNFSFPAKTDIVEIVGYGYYNSELNPFDNGYLSELDKQCSLDKPGSKWSDVEQLCAYTNATTVGGHAIPDSNDVPMKFDYVIETDGLTFGSQYEISGGTIEKIVYDEHRNSLVISLNDAKQGYMQIVIQTGLLHNFRELPFNYVVTIDGEEVVFEQLSPILLRIPFQEDNKQIEIIGVS